MARKKSFLDIITKQRSEKKREKFEGTFLDYLNLVQENSSIIKLSHKRLYETILGSGVKTLDIDNDEYRDIFNGDKIRVYDYFSKEFFGMEAVINKLMRYLKSAAFTQYEV